MTFHRCWSEGAEWLLRSGIQQSSFGVARFYKTDAGVNAPVSTEITGYTVSALAFVYTESGDPRFKVRLEQTAEYLITTVWNPELKIFPYEMEDGEPRLSYFFDSGIIIRGLLAAWKVTKNAKFLEVAQEAAAGMIAAFGGGVHMWPIIRLPAMTTLPEGDNWSSKNGCYQLKSALAWREVSAISQDPAILSNWQTALKMARSWEPKFLPGHLQQRKVMDRLHAFGYYLEGLLQIPRSPRRKEELQRGINEISEYLKAAGNGCIRSDVYAQLLRIRLFAADEVPLDEASAEQEAHALEAYQCFDQDPRLHGGFWFATAGKDFLPFINPVSTIFALQALQMWHRWRQGVASWTSESLI